MFNISFLEDYEGYAFDEETLVLIVNHIAQKAEKKFGPGNISKSLVVLDSDMDRIFLSADPNANKDSDPDYIIRTWEYSYKEHLTGDCISIDWTFHLMGDCEDMEGICSQDHCDGSDEIPLDDEKTCDPSGFKKDDFEELDRCLENQLYPDLDYLWERYGDDGLYKVFSSFSDPEEDVDYYSAETIKRLATVSKTCASEMELCASCAVDGFEKEDHFRAISLLLSFGEEFTDTLSYNDFDDYVCGYGDIDRILYYFDPELLRKYGLEDVVEEIFKALNCEYADYFWEYYIDQFPNFITDILPIVHEHIAKGSADAKNVFTKIEHYHQ